MKPSAEGVCERERVPCSEIGVSVKTVSFVITDDDLLHHLPVIQSFFLRVLRIEYLPGEAVGDVGRFLRFFEAEGVSEQFDSPFKGVPFHCFCSSFTLNYSLTNSQQCICKSCAINFLASSFIWIFMMVFLGYVVRSSSWHL